MELNSNDLYLYSVRYSERHKGEKMKKNVHDGRQNKHLVINFRLIRKHQIPQTWENTFTNKTHIFYSKEILNAHLTGFYKILLGFKDLEERSRKIFVYYIMIVQTSHLFYNLWSVSFWNISKTVKDMKVSLALINSYVQF